MIKLLLNNLKKHEDAENKFLFLLAFIITIISVFAYIMAKKNLDYYEETNKNVTILLITDAVIFVILLLLTLKKFSPLLMEARKGFKKKTRLYFNTIVSFTCFISIPTTIVSLFSIFFFHYSIESWFNHKVNKAISNSLMVADLYLEEHQKNIKNDILAVKNGIDNGFFILINEPEEFNEQILREAEIRSLIEIMVFQGNRVLAQTSLSFPLAFERLSIEELARADQGEVIISYNNEEKKMKALVKLNSAQNTYLIVGRLIDEKVLLHINKTKSAVSEYKKLKENINHLQFSFIFIFLIISLILVIISVLLGIGFASKIIRPIVELIYAQGEIESGNFRVRISEKGNEDEITELINAFNLMAEQLQHQRTELLNVNEEINVKRIFSETVLTGVSAGVIAIDTDEKITLVNKSALNLLGQKEENLDSSQLKAELPEFYHILQKLKNSNNSNIVEEINLRCNGKKMVFLVKITIEQDFKDIKGYVITFDDITILSFAQRTAAWADIARRIAHEIKNPLTPISLAAQRLNKKFSSEVKDRVSFNRYTDTITKNIAAIIQIVEEFTNFARMPSANLVKNNICNIVKETIFSREIIDQNIKYQFVTEDEEIFLDCDADQLHQVMLNLYKNAEESILEKNIEGLISTKIIKTNSYILVSVKDNGKGIQEEIFTNLTKPYITNKTIGTGLGLAIVKKILDDHNAKIEFENLDEGLIVNIYFSNEIYQSE